MTIGIVLGGMLELSSSSQLRLIRRSVAASEGAARVTWEDFPVLTSDIA